MAQAITTQLPHSGTTHRRFQMEPNTNTVPINVISDTFNTAQAVLENHEQRIGKIEKADTASQVTAENVASCMSTSEVAAEIDCQDVAGYIDASDVADSICCGGVANHIDMQDLADYIDTDLIVERATDSIDLYSLAREFDTGDIAREFDTSDIADEIDLDDVADNINMIELANTITENNASELGNGLLGAMMDAFSERNNLRDEVRELRKQFRDRETQLLDEINVLKMELNSSLPQQTETSAPAPEVSNG
jgi:DNA-binding transcriptional regulator YdaS (Cro superfamily)